MNLPSDPRLPIITDEKIKPLTQRLYELFRQIFTAINDIGSGPAFIAIRGISNQSVSAGSWQKVGINQISKDTSSAFDTTNNRFNPKVAGWYSLIGYVSLSTGNAVAGIGLNGVPNNGTGWGLNTTVGKCCDLFYMNGTTDYLELYVYPSSAALIYFDGKTYFKGFLARPA